MADVEVMDVVDEGIDVSVDSIPDTEVSLAVITNHEPKELSEENDVEEQPSNNGHGGNVHEEEKNGDASKSGINPLGSLSGKSVDNGIEKDGEAKAKSNMERAAVPTPSILPKKSNLKRSKCSPEANGLSASAIPSKKIRIVENLDTSNSNNNITLDSEVENDNMQGVDETASILEEESCGEKMVWLNSASSHVNQSNVNVDFVRDNLSPVKRNFSVEIDMRFILTETVTAILTTKSKIASIGPTDFHLWIARNSSHSDKSKSFMYQENFLRMANLDALLKYDLTSPKELVNSSNFEEIYYVGDLWYNSKGYREYILWATNQQQAHFSTKILAMKTIGPRSTEKNIRDKAGILFHERTPLKTDSDDLKYLCTEMVESCGGFSDPQDILIVETINRYVDFVLARSGGKGLHTFLVDNPEVSYAYESCREVRYQKYFYVECLIALRCLREGGTFICKIFDSFTLFTTGLLFLLYKCFTSISIHKPSSSPACTSERFVICKGKIDNADTIYVVDFLSDCLDMVVNNQEQRKIVRRRVRRRLAVLRMEVQTLVPLRVILSHADFFQFIRESNIRLSTQLIQSIDKLCELMGSGGKISKDETAAVMGASNFSILSLQNVPSVLKFQESIDVKIPIEACKHFLTGYNIREELFDLNEKLIEGIDLLLPKVISSDGSKDLFAFPIQSRYTAGINKPVHGFFFGCGGSNILHFEGNGWRHLDCPELVLPYGTLVMGEIAEEVCTIGKDYKFVRCFHLFDAVFICGAYVGSYALEIRQQILSRFINCLKNPSTNVNQNIFMVQSYVLKDVPEFYNNICSSEAHNFIGYNSKLRRYMTKKQEIKKKENWAFVGGFLIIENSMDSSPENFFSKHQSSRSIWIMDERKTVSEVTA
ncbi:unnamed protein product [Orchesella dallaii]|uniref:Cap-specific mRNA (nucleoside-2'-O-)-methyltransferase 1 n=1 Tax=Orchesella dallaii TaxID=48710 RepID=A0ABP1RG24_9HEXA